MSAKDSNMMRFRAWLNEAVDVRILAIYRIIFGCFMAFNIARYFRIGLIENMYVLPKINFKYDGFYWLEPMPELYMNILLGLLLIASALIGLGVLFKWSCRFFAIGYLYIFLLDKSIYNNHIYLFILIALLLSFTDADKSLNPFTKRTSTRSIPRWQQVILQLQIVIVYFYGGLAKITYNWIFEAEPVRTMINNLEKGSLIAGITSNEIVIQLINFGGLALDLAAPILLWYKPFRKWSIWVFIGFNLMNSWLFQDIGIFPFVMLANLILFYNFHELPLIGNRVVSGLKTISLKQRDAAWAHSGFKFIPEPIKNTILVAYFIFQLLFPFRGHFLPNDLDWTTIGNRFSWRMKVDSRIPEKVNFYIESSSLAGPTPVEIQTFINDMQILNLTMDPRSIRDFSVFLRNEAMQYGTVDPAIRGELMIRYNGKPAVAFVNPLTDLSKADYSPFRRMEWVGEKPR